ncbi:MAG TPA: arsenate reductase ArsC [Trueperaceae bacterium]|nr:arsenate reductase ArsC [Trueperaceae bacterium]
MTRLLVLCTHNSARSQMMEGWLRHHAREAGLELEVWSAGTEKSGVKEDAVTVMAEAGIDLSAHSSKTLFEVPDPWAFDVVLTVCDDANEACPAYPARTERRHVRVPDPSGRDRHAWRRVRDGLCIMSRCLVGGLADGRTASDAELEEALSAATADPGLGTRVDGAAGCAPEARKEPGSARQSEPWDGTAGRGE